MGRALNRVSLSLVVFGAVLLASPSVAQHPSRFTIGLLGGVGGSFDAEPDPGLTNSSVQLNLVMLDERAAQLGLRIGRLDLGGDDRLGSLTDARLDYVSVAGEYLVHRSYYTSGLYLGLGGYQLQGRLSGEEDWDETALGVAVGATGLFRLARRWSVLTEFSVHWADLEEAQLFGMAHAGIAFHW